jgi:hypothetical protein
LIRGCLTKLVLLSIFGVAVLYAVIAVTSPWTFHIGGRSTPLLYWHGSGRLLAKGGAAYPLYVLFYPKESTSSPGGRREGLRSTGDLQGSGSLCIAPGVIQKLRLTGTVYGAWSTTDGSLMAFRMLEGQYFDVGQQQGFFDLAGRWRGPELVLDHPGEQGNTFRSGLRIEAATVTLDWSSYSDFEAACARMASLPAQR